MDDQNQPGATPGQPGQLRCPTCGAYTPGPSFCTECGAPLGAAPAVGETPAWATPGPPQVGYQAPPGQPPVGYAPPAFPQPAPARRAFPWKKFVAAWIVLLLLGASGGFAYGFYFGPGPGPDVPTDDQNAVIDTYGDPAAFVVADGPVGPGEDSARMEQWSYSGVTVYFVNGRKAAEEQTTLSGVNPDPGAPPWDFDRSMKSGDVEDLLGEEGVEVPDVETDFKDYHAYAYENSRLIVGYLDGWVYSVQTY